MADIYAARESPIQAADIVSLISGLRDHGHKSAAGLAGPDQLAAEIGTPTPSGDVVMCLRTGDITASAATRPYEFDKFAGESACPPSMTEVRMCEATLC